jgi:hypothetical protein
MNYASVRDQLSKYSGEDRPPFIIQKVDEREIEEAETQLGFAFNDDLKEFWRNIGCGLIWRQHPLLNDGEVIDPPYRISDPIDIADTIAADPKRFDGILPFFDIGDGGWLVIRKDGSIMYDDLLEGVLASNIKEFLRKILEDALFFHDTPFAAP